MRELVQGVSSNAREIDPDFIVIPQNGHELITSDGTPNGSPAMAYLDAVDGVGREDLYYGYDRDDAATPAAERNEMIAFLDVAEANGLEVLVTDYCSTPSIMDDSYQQNSARGFISFAADRRELDNVPAHPTDPFNVSDVDINSLADARNFLYLLDPGEFGSRSEFVAAILTTNHDILITDPFFAGAEPLSRADVTAIGTKQNGGRRLVIAYMSVGEAEDYRYYWQSAWREGAPSWMASENPDWPGNYKVRYWDQDWQTIIYGQDDSYVARIVGAGFDGVYLDIIDAFEFFEELN